ncbi:hypothetical protein [Sporolactobacillus laevolacticus]|uniref:hypothetical protein n=1 Tax=Sporolactobacillus laevolacticus TaxID=33018 RepID=UPI0025B5F15A|nr:hypothetical protein [Sporolactobacillus laevolacticus]MDN3953792.1 hypothetical protein [Sporolactobacillus laevolacticus]
MVKNQAIRGCVRTTRRRIAYAKSRERRRSGVSNDDFESKPVQLAISRKDAQWMKASFNDDEEEDDE